MPRRPAGRHPPRLGRLRWEMHAMTQALQSFTLDVNGHTHAIEADPDMPLLYALRNDLGLNNPHFGCGLEQCGACTVHLDGRPTRFCVTAFSDVVGVRIADLLWLGPP